MHRFTFWPALGLGATLVVACGDDSASTATNTLGGSESDSVGDTSDSNTTNPTGGVSDSVTGTSTTTDGTVSDSLGGTTTTTEPTTTTAGPTSDPSTGPDDTSTGTTQGVSDTNETNDTTTTGGPDETTGSTSTGETTDATTDPTADPTGDPDDCPLVMKHLPCDMASDDALHAFGLNCTTLGGDYINNDTAIAVQNLDFKAPPVLEGRRAWQVAKSYGTFIDPMTQKPFWGSREGDKLLMISSGLLPAPVGGVVTVDDGDVFNDTFFSFNQAPWDDNTMPPPMSPTDGSPDPMGYTNCNGIGDCSNTVATQWMLGNNNAEDKMWFKFDLKAPAKADGDTVDAKGYTFDFAYFSAEFPEYVGSGFNDIFIVWQDSEAYTGNVTFIKEQPLTVTALWPIDFQGECNTFIDFNCVNPADEHLADTGHQNFGGATGWYTAIGGVKPGETFGLSFGIFDMGDSSFDTTALLDNFQWDCEGCIPNEVESCGVMPQ